MAFRSTKEAAHVLGISPGYLSRALWEEKVTPPERGPGGVYLWTTADINRASWQLLGRAANLRGSENDGE